MNLFSSYSHPTKRYFAIVVAFLFTMTACKKKQKEEEGDTIDRTTLTNCKIPIADGRGGVAIGFPRYTERLKSTGHVVATVIMVDFSDSPATMTPDDAFKKISGATDTFTEMSYAKMQYELTPIKHWYRMKNPSTSYKFNTYEAHLAYIAEAVALADADVDFSSTDSLVILSNPDTTGLGEAGPAFTANPGGGVTADGKEILNATTSAHDINTWGSIWLNHEVTHTLGLVDLYAYDRKDASNSYDTLRFTGEYSYMGYNSFKANSPGLTAWERWLLGWLDDEQVTCANPFKDGEINADLTPISEKGGKKAIVVPVGETRVVVVESRRAKGIDKNMTKPGVLVYTVDSSIQSGKGPIKVYPTSPDDPRFLNSTRAKDESVTIEGLKIEVTASSDEGDSVRLTPTGD